MTDDDRAAFRTVLHEWARRQLEEKSWHAGPFEIIDVRLVYDPGFFGGSDVTPPDPSITDIRIQFRHDGEACSRPSYLADRRCWDQSWSPRDSEDTVSMVNQLLAIADEADGTPTS
jgi:hypothetical protein